MKRRRKIKPYKIINAILEELVVIFFAFGFSLVSYLALLEVHWLLGAFFYGCGAYFMIIVLPQKKIEP